MERLLENNLLLVEKRGRGRKATIFNVALMFPEPHHPPSRHVKMDYFTFGSINRYITGLKLTSVRYHRALGILIFQGMKHLRERQGC